MAWPLPVLGAWLCAPVPFLTELYKGLLKKKKKKEYKQSALEKRENTGNCPEHREHPIPAKGWREKVEAARCPQGKLTQTSLLPV